MLDQMIQRLQNIHPFNIHQIMEDGSHQPWWHVDGSIIQDLVIRDTDLAVQVQAVAAQVAHWGRMVAQTKRIWEMEERAYRSWRSKFYLDHKTQEKPPSDKAIDAMYRTAPAYAIYQTAIERAEEAHESARAIYDAFKAKRDMLKSTVYRNRNDGSVGMSV